MGPILPSGVTLDQSTSLPSGMLQLVGLSINHSSRWTHPPVTGILKLLVMADHTHTWW